MKKIKVIAIVIVFSIIPIQNVKAEDAVTLTFYNENNQIASVIEVPYGSRFEIPTCLKEGYNFHGYNTKSDGSGESLNSNIALKSESYYPVFTPYTYTVSYYVNDTLYHQEQITHGSNAPNITVPTTDGMVFSGWKGLLNVTEDRNLYAVYSEIEIEEVTAKESVDPTKGINYKRIEVKEYSNEIQESEIAESNNIDTQPATVQITKNITIDKTPLLIGVFLLLFVLTILFLKLKNKIRTRRM